MAERAAHLLDHVFPDVPVRQWVLSLPYRMRYQLAWNHDVCRAVVAVFLRAVLGFLRARARDSRIADGRGGAVAVIQRFGGALNLNLHIHALVLDGVFARNRAGTLNFHPVARLIALDVAEVLATVEPRIKRLFDRRGLGDARCGGRLRLIALIEEAAVIGRLLRHFGVPTEIPAPRLARAPPLSAGAPNQAGWDHDPSVFTSCS
jgi:putative transposase